MAFLSQLVYKLDLVAEIINIIRQFVSILFISNWNLSEWHIWLSHFSSKFGSNKVFKKIFEKFCNHASTHFLWDWCWFAFRFQWPTVLHRGRLFPIGKTAQGMIVLCVYRWRMLQIVNSKIVSTSSGGRGSILQIQMNVNKSTCITWW